MSANPTPPQVVTIVIPGRPVPKKNSPVMVKDQNIILPSKAFRDYRKFCLGTKTRPGWLLVCYGNLQFTGPVWVSARYWLPDYRWWPDLVGLMQGTGDLLEAAGIITNDRNIVSWGGSHIAGIDRDDPRAEINLAEVGRPKWWRE